MTEFHTGGCVCGSVRYQVSGDPARVTICHCKWCQRRTGTAFGVEAVFEEGQVELLSGQVARYKHISDESGRWLEMEFCPTCGSNLGFRLEAVAGIRTIAAGTFDDPSWIRADRYKFRHIYLRSAQNWAVVPSDVEAYEAHFRP